MDIRRATVADLDGLAPLFDQYRMFGNQPSDVEAARNFLFERITNDESVIFIGVEDGRYLGFTQLYPSFSSLFIKRLWILNDLFVTAESRGKGLGKLLLDAAVQLAVETNAKGVKLQTDVNNVGAQRFYETNGWTRDQRHFYYFVNI
ncbi:N-acetyltransferase family protein [Brevibacillus fluminis]|uniref:GNAT family N-acetyltransferase n=1 Tax=Brevibacillus fluminis TaxID=511487 RepID=UPI003F8C0458